MNIISTQNNARNQSIKHNQWRRSQIKSGGINIEKIEGLGSVEGLCPPLLGVFMGLAPRKKIILR